MGRRGSNTQIAAQYVHWSPLIMVIMELLPRPQSGQPCPRWANGFLLLMLFDVLLYLWAQTFSMEALQPGTCLAGWRSTLQSPGEGYMKDLSLRRPCLSQVTIPIETLSHVTLQPSHLLLSGVAWVFCHSFSHSSADTVVKICLCLCSIFLPSLATALLSL